MAAYSSIDRETFAWVKAEVEATLAESREELKSYTESVEKDNRGNHEPLYAIITQLHQVVGSLQILELKSLSSLMMEGELLVEDYLKPDTSVKPSAMGVLLESSIQVLQDSLAAIEAGLPENPIEVVELVNQIRSIRGLEAVEISSLFSPDIDVFPELAAQTPLLDDDYKRRATSLRRHFQTHLLYWLRDNNTHALDSLSTVAEKLLAMSTFGAVARLWWVALGYIDYVKNNTLQNRAVHGRIFRGMDDLLRKLEQQGEPALVRDPGEEVIKIMLFYTGVGVSRTNQMDTIASAFSLHDYFTNLEGYTDNHSHEEIQAELDKLGTVDDLHISEIRQLITDHFESNATDASTLAELVKQMQKLGDVFAVADIDIASPLVSEALDVARNLLNGSVESSDDNGFHLAAAIIFIENSLSGIELVDEHWVQKGQLKLQGLKAINNQEVVTAEMDGAHLTGSERKALLDVVGSEVEGSLQEIERRLEKFSKNPEDISLLEGIAPQIKHVRGALQVLGEQKVGLLLQLSEQQFAALEAEEVVAMPALIDALATAVGTMEEYVIGLQFGRKNMDSMLDRSITDLELAIGKKVSRDDVENLLDQSSDSLFSWLAEQSDFALFTDLKANLRDLRTLAKKTGLRNVEELVKEQNRLIDVISQEPAFLTDNITFSLQNNMASITADLIHLYGTEDTPEEIAADVVKSLAKDNVTEVTADEPQIHDDMELEELGNELPEPDEGISATEIGKQHAASHQDDLDEDPIFTVFVEESTEVLSEARRLHDVCSENSSDRESIRDLRRAFHTLKGSSRMVGLNEVGEIAWLSESLFNYVLDTEKPITKSILEFSNSAIQEIQSQLDDGYKNQHLIDTVKWGEKTERVRLDEQEAEADKSEAGVDSQPVEESPAQESPVEANLDEEGSALESVADEASQVESYDEEDSLEEPDSDLQMSENLSLDDGDSENDVEFEDSLAGLRLEVDGLPEELIEQESETIDYVVDSSDDESARSEVIEDGLEQSYATTGAADPDEEQTAAFNVIDDQEMRDVFIKEATQHLATISEALAHEPLTVRSDDDLSIAIHTMLGNARTLDLKSFARAYDLAEHICTRKQGGSQPLNHIEQTALAGLVSASLDTVSNAQNEVPYFPINDDEWTAVESKLQLALDELTPAIESEDKSTLLQDGVDEVIELSSDFEFRAEEDLEIENDDIEMVDGDESVARVASIFEGLESIDDLVESGSGKVEGSSIEDLDDLQDFETALESFKADPLENSAANTAETEADSVAQGDQETQIDDGADAESENRESLLPEELTNLIQEDLLNLGAAVEGLGITDGEAQGSDFFDLEVDTTEVEGDIIELTDVDHPVHDEDKTDSELINEEDHVDSSEELSELPSSENLEMETEGEGSSADDPEVGIEFELRVDEGADSNTELEIITEESADVAVPATDEAETSEEPAVVEVAQPDAAGVSFSLFEGVDIDEDLRTIFVSEMKSIHQDLDSEVANLVQMQSTPEAMANIMRMLHTVKGSSMMAEANALGELTHQTESYLEGSFIRNADDLRQVRTTLELYVDALDLASDAYENKSSLTLSPELVERIGGLDDIALPSIDASNRVERAADEDDAGLTAFDINEELASTANRGAKIFSKWKSARSWKKTKPALQSEYGILSELVAGVEDLAPLADFVTASYHHIAGLEITNSAGFKANKGLLEELFDSTIANANLLISGQDIEDLSALQTQLSAPQDPDVAAQKAVVPNVQSESDSLADKEEVAREAIFVPGAVQVDQQDLKDLDRQQKAARERAAALRIQTETLDSLTNFVGDASMNRSQMREDVLSVKNTVDGLYENVQRFSQQLRELEIEADSKITARSNEPVAKDRGEEFDPLELDRYSKLQQLSRGLADNLDELNDIQTSLSNFVYRAETSLQKQDRLNRELQDEIMQVRLVSFGGIGPQLRQVVRRTSRELNKDVELEIVGADVRLDKAILDGVVPALEHMLRNAVDHGIESRDARSKTKKSKIGRITVECRQVAREIVIGVRDDGVGLDLEKIRARAVEENMLAEDQPLNPSDMLMYISQSGFSTASTLTQVSGRGVGMDVVQNTLRRMSGSIAYDLDNDQAGSSFTIRLPISLAVTSAMFVHAGREQFAVSARTIERVVNIDSKELGNALSGEKPGIDIAGQNYSLIDLADYLGYNSAVADFDGKMAVILVDAGVQNIAVIVDELLDTQEIVVKNLGGHLGRIPIYAGATIRADGNVVLLIDLVGISYYESFISMPDLGDTPAQNIPNVMVVDDSLTVRKSAERDISGLGINAILAKDGIDAQEQLGSIKPDMILLDIEMPRMDGFELLEWVRANASLKSIPVVMISSRATEKHINKANQLGCDAFLGKPYLLENLVTMFNQYLPLDTQIELEQ